jgi:YidC/Oxa1 family membrane protein insertase
MFLIPANIFQPLIDVFEAVLKFFHNTVGVSWGLSIVLMTVAVRALLLPLAFKQFHSMQKLQRLGPELKQIQNKYKEDKQRQQQEVMKFYKENEVNPFASCLPLVAQIPVFIGLFYMLRTSLRKDICPAVQAAFKANYAHLHGAAAAAGQTTYCTNSHYAHYYHGGAGFLFIPDLTNKATGGVLIALLIMYVGTQLLSSLLMSTPTMDKNQRRIMMLLPLFFVVIVINFPAGLLLYWITTNVWTIAQQYVIKRRLGPVSPPAPATAAAGPGGGPRGAGGAPPSGPDDGGGTNGVGPNGAGSKGGLSGVLGRLRQPTEAPAAVATRKKREAPPPPSPRKKKKRSGRRR